MLYRLLFILYAEARELLPLRESASYRADYSLDALKREIGPRKAGGAALPPCEGLLLVRELMPPNTEPQCPRRP